MHAIDIDHPNFRSVKDVLATSGDDSPPPKDILTEVVSHHSK